MVGMYCVGYFPCWDLLLAPVGAGVISTERCLQVSMQLQYMHAGYHLVLDRE
jgi:hypothetical protein